MKHINFKQLLMLLALTIIVQNGAVIAAGTGENPNPCSEDGGVAPCSDYPLLDDVYD